MIKLERCRSHNRNNSPSEYELVGEYATPTEAIKELWSYQTVCAASGDEYRLTENGAEVVVLSANEIAPAA